MMLVRCCAKQDFGGLVKSKKEESCQRVFQNGVTLRLWN